MVLQVVTNRSRAFPAVARAPRAATPPRRRVLRRTRAVEVAVGDASYLAPPRTDPYVQLSRIRLLPRVCNGKAIARPGMENDRFREKVVRLLRHPFPRDPILLAASPQRAPPEVGHMMPEHAECASIGRHCVIVEVATEDLPQPFPLLGDQPVHASSQRFLDLP